MKLVISIVGTTFVFMILMIMLVVIILGIAKLIDLINGCLKNKNWLSRDLANILLCLGVITIALIIGGVLAHITIRYEDKIKLLHKNEVSSVIFGAMSFVISSIFFGLPDWSEPNCNEELTFLGKQRKFLTELYLAVITASLGIWQQIPWKDLTRDLIKHREDNYAPTEYFLVIAITIAVVMTVLMGVRQFFHNQHPSKFYKFKDDNYYNNYEPAKFKKSIFK